jgi:hypothetical protein
MERAWHFQEGALILAKKLLILLFLVVTVGAGYGLVSAYISSHRTAEAVASSFMNDLSQGDGKRTYEQFSAGFKKSRTGSDWQGFVNHLGRSDQPAVLLRKSAIIDRFNVYPAASNPQRFTYTLHIKNRDYQATAVILKEDSAWKIDDFQGSYK